ncbi:hypothetical protein VCHA53P481_360033 [Vibrio chagasii]|nr:hypothetical protein VCHA32O87_360036 [Vibrio chagasii]CAH6917198.1 hypothetical protein VCHA28FP16_300041 [Vibrio chagasii]CAH7229991.1 hypothetical protein VCHA43P284_350011 [Vibrio chagasii]CAH7257893.1 hypothetical protein VCHA53P481_360033 [Vibrio chagasii]CAH7396996.1 hypothetical protein VCHA38O209_260031 [Vibrio chagasii]
MLHDQMELPTGQIVRPQQILVGIALLGIQSELDIKNVYVPIKSSKGIG